MVTYAEERSCITQFELGELFRKGGQQSRDYTEAVRWYKNAAIKGSRQAQNRLGRLITLKRPALHQLFSGYQKPWLL